MVWRGAKTCTQGFFEIPPNDDKFIVDKNNEPAKTIMCSGGKYSSQYLVKELWRRT